MRRLIGGSARALGGGSSAVVVVALLVHASLLVCAWQPPAPGLRAGPPHSRAPRLSGPRAPPRCPPVPACGARRTRVPAQGLVPAAMPPGGGEAPRRRKRMPPKPVPTATEDDMQEFVGILAGVRNGNETDIPALLAGKVEFLLSRDIAQLMQRLDSQCANEDERGELNSLFNIVIDFVEQFVSNTALMSEANGQLLREIFEAAASGMTPLDAKMKAMLSGQDPRYTPEFIRFLDAEIVRLRREVAKQVSRVSVRAQPCSLSWPVLLTAAMRAVCVHATRVFVSLRVHLCLRTRAELEASQKYARASRPCLHRRCEARPRVWVGLSFHC
jgi:hypothetical protein